jgi:hypothetical protein
MAASINGTFHDQALMASNERFLCGPAPTPAQFKATNASTGIHSSSRGIQSEGKPWHKLRKISPQAGRAIEILGHAIEYLADEHALDCMTRPERALAGAESGLHPQIAAIELLKARNREVYFSCPEVLSISDRMRSWLHVQRA